ncbi:MAG TPA: hypothetical protein VFQ72_01105 [Candidatus Paceibacterota bacterium]|nr:hypothetical protein [Candidatus Paceibacterota bacterium]
MTDKIFSKLNVYDQIGYLLVGSIASLVFLFNNKLLGSPIDIPAFDISSLIIWAIVAYFVGHIVHAVANIIIKENKTDFSESDKEILERGKHFFDLKKQELNATYLLCYMLASAKDVTGQVQSFNAYYSLYRGWFIIFLLEMNFLSFTSIMHGFSLHILILFSIASFIAYLTLNRTRRFYGYSRAKTLQTFTLIEKLKL